jgi:uncharacterized membrane protein YebE (DUF533 family)
MKKAMTILTALGILLGLTITSFAYQAKPLKNKVPVARKRQQQQHQRIRQGVRSGELTKPEVKSLGKEQREINQEIKEAKSDGVVTGAERKEIHQEQKQASRHIYRKKHNRRDRN